VTDPPGRPARTYVVVTGGQKEFVRGWFRMHTDEETGVTALAIELADEEAVRDLPPECTVINVDAGWVPIWPPKAFLEELVDVPGMELQTPVPDADGNLTSIKVETVHGVVPLGSLERPPRDPDRPPPGLS
jgi:hypothetical protein